MGQKETFGRVLRYIKKYWLYLAASIVMASVTVALTLYFPILTGRVIDLVIGAGQVDFGNVFVILRQMAVIAVATGAAQWIRTDRFHLHTSRYRSENKAYAL